MTLTGARSKVGTCFRSLGNTKLLARINLVYVLEHRLVGFKDFLVLIGIAVYALGNIAEGVARFHFDVFGFSSLAARNSHLVVDFIHAMNIAQRDDNLFPFLLIGDLPFTVTVPPLTSV